MIAFIVGVVTGSVCTWYMLRVRVSAWRESRDSWRETAEQRAAELEAADVQGELEAAQIKDLEYRIIELAAEKTELNRLLDLNGVIR
jgi:hypothetical protein